MEIQGKRAQLLQYYWYLHENIEMCLQGRLQ